VHDLRLALAGWTLPHLSQTGPPHSCRSRCDGSLGPAVRAHLPVYGSDNAPSYAFRRRGRARSGGHRCLLVRIEAWPSLNRIPKDSTANPRILYTDEYRACRMRACR